MALLYSASLVPSKLELVAGWAPGQHWFVGEPDAGLVRAGDGAVMQVPLTYRDAPLDGAENATAL